MKNFVPILACGSMNLGPGVTAIILSVLALWITAAVLAVFNLVFLCKLADKKAIKTAHHYFFGFYLLLAIMLCTGNLIKFFNFGYADVGLLISVFGIPSLAIVHFFCLRSKYWKFRRMPEIDGEKVSPMDRENSLVKNSNKKRYAIAFTVLIALAALVFTINHGKKAAVSTTDPLKSWRELSSMGWNGLAAPGEHLPPLSKAITDDFQDFINKLPIRKDHANHSESYWIDEVSVFEDGAGRRAVKIHIPLDGTHWNYVLIYDKTDKRIKVIKYVSGHYAS